MAQFKNQLRAIKFYPNNRKKIQRVIKKDFLFAEYITTVKHALDDPDSKKAIISLYEQTIFEPEAMVSIVDHKQRKKWLFKNESHSNELFELNIEYSFGSFLASAVFLFCINGSLPDSGTRAAAGSSDSNGNRV